MHIETVKVVSDNPAHEQGYVIKNACDLTDADVLFDALEKKKADSAETEGDTFDRMDADALKAFLKVHEVKFHHLAGEDKLRDLCRSVDESV